MRQARFAAFAMMSVLLAGWLVTPTWGQEDRVVATVNGQPIMESQLNDELLLRWGDRTIVSMMQELAIEQAAAEAGVSVTEAELDRRVQDLQVSIDMQAHQTGKTFSLWLAERQLPRHGLKSVRRGELPLEK